MSRSAASSSRVGIVAIGRNEGERLRLCLQSALRDSAAVVYVDSGSSDGSVALARSMGAEVVLLDPSTPFTAARSRNAGVARLVQLWPRIGFVQVMDSDCELVEGWIDQAVAEMDATIGADAGRRVAVVCGRRRERFPKASIYNRLCDLEWDTPIGDADSCGGDALIRIEAFQQVGGYNESIIAGEEPEMCLRLRATGVWTIWRIDRDMTLHDANMTRFVQWWKRMVRSGHAYAEGRALHGRTHGYCVREVRSIIEWGVLLPAISLGLAWFTWGASLVLFAGYALLWHRVRGHRLTRGDSPAAASLYAQYCILGKFAQLEGMARYWWNRLRGRRTKLIEYKLPPALQGVSVRRAEPQNT